MKKRVLVVDNIDSFVYNLVQYVGMLGAEVEVISNLESKKNAKRIIKEKQITHIIISPGPKTPREAGVSNYIIREFSGKLPILGVCLGHQCIGYVYGAKIKKAKVLTHGKTSLIRHNGDEIFKDMENPFEATRYHSLVIAKENFPSSLEIIAESEDDKEIMAIKHRKFLLYGFQFHPESILTKNGILLIKNFLEMKNGIQKSFG